LNQLRTVVAHRYGSIGNARDHLEQLRDSNTFDRGLIFPGVWAPLGMRYHALHHLMPSMPYHAMGQAHRRLMQHLPSGSPYHQTLQCGLWSSLTNAFLQSARRLPDRKIAQLAAKKQMMPELRRHDSTQ